MPTVSKREQQDLCEVLKDHWRAYGRVDSIRVECRETNCVKPAVILSQRRHEQLKKHNIIDTSFVDAPKLCLSYLFLM
jgi:hypothetical protein